MDKSCLLIQSVTCTCLDLPFWLSQIINIQAGIILSVVGALSMEESQKAKSALTIQLMRSMTASKCLSSITLLSLPSTASTALRSKTVSITSLEVITLWSLPLIYMSPVTPLEMEQAEVSSWWMMALAQPRSAQSGAISNSRWSARITQSSSTTCPKILARPASSTAATWEATN